MTAITLTAGARYGYAGKQYIARIVGRHPKWTFQREFIGKKSGKRGEDSEAMVDDPGLYETRDVDRKGNADDTYQIIYNDPLHGLLYQCVEKDVAMRLAKEPPADWRTTALQERLIDAEANADKQCTVLTPVGRLRQGDKATFAEVAVVIRAELGLDVLMSTDPAESMDLSPGAELVRRCKRLLERWDRLPASEREACGVTIAALIDDVRTAEALR